MVLVWLPGYGEKKKNLSKVDIYICILDIYISKVDIYISKVYIYTYLR